MITNKNTSNVLIIFLLFHLLVWTLIPTFSNINLPLDTIEALAWGSNLDWGFDKHPPLSALAVELFFKVFGNQDWAYYFLSQIFVIVAFYVVYKFSIEFFNSKRLALFSLFLIEGIFFYNFTTPEFNVNIAQLPFWSLSILFTWRCFTHDKISDYVFLGVCIGLGILSKYIFTYLILGIILFFIYLVITRKKIKFLKIFISCSIVLLILFPHINWLIDNNFTTIMYGLKRTGETGHIINHIVHPIIFLVKQIGILIPLFVMFFLLLKKNKLRVNLKDKKLIFLFFTVLGPVFLIFLTSLLMGIKIRTMWMTPFYLFFGVILIYIFQKEIMTNGTKKFFIVFFFFLIFYPLTYLGISLVNDHKRTDYPGKEIARLVQNKWDSNFSNEIKIVVGDEWSAGNLSYHLNSRPKWILDLQNKTSFIGVNDGVVYTGNPKILKKVCPGVFGTIKPVGYCMIGKK